MTRKTGVPLVSVVLPTLNERDNITRLILALAALIPQECEFLVVDDASTDGTPEAVGQLALTVPGVRLFFRFHEKGVASAIQRGIAESRGEFIVWMDCDFSMPPETVPALLAPVMAGVADAAIGSRYCAGKCCSGLHHDGFLLGLHYRFARLLNRLITLCSGQCFFDWTSGFVAIRASLARATPLHGRHGEYCILLLATLLGQGLKLMEVPYRWTPRTHGSSKTAASFLGLLCHGLRYGRVMFIALRMLRRKAGSG